MSYKSSEMAKIKDTLKDLALSEDSNLNERINNWLTWDTNPKTWSEIYTATQNKEWDKLTSLLCTRLPFGTAGLRGEMRAGFNAMNDLVVIQTAQGLCAYLLKQFPDETTRKERGIVIGYDGRHNSNRFAELTAFVFSQSNFRVYLYKRYVATPIVPFTIKMLNCLAGVMVTASHNRKEDNGYKVYWTNSAQIIPPHDAGIYECILKNLEPAHNYSEVDEAALSRSALISDPYDDILPAYNDSLLKVIPDEYIQANGKSPLKFAYTAMHGVGYAYVQQVFKKVNLQPVVPVVEQVKPDPDFPTTPIPNPEEGKQSLDMAIKTAAKEKCQIILANDPDADRLAVAEAIPDSEGKFKLFSGNEVGALLGWWALEMLRKREPNADLANCTMISSTVSSKILKSMAKIEGFQFYETLTGFKWMANMAIAEEAKNRNVLLAFEEAIGFMISTTVPDKDGVSAAAHVATMASYLQREKNMTLQNQLDQIYMKYGLHTSVSSYLKCSDPVLIKQIFNRLRTFADGAKNTYPTSILGGKFLIEHVRDLTTGYDSSTADKKATLPVSASSQMITFTFANGVIVTLRTSGTEPKLKYYAEMCGKPEDKNWTELTETLNCMVGAIVNEFYQPEKHNLRRKSID